MALVSLDEIEARAREYAAKSTLPGGYVRMDVAFLADAILGLVAHVRALTETTLVIDQRQRGAAQRVDMVTDRITALEEKVAALEKVLPARGDLASDIKHALEKKKAEDVVRDLRAENAELKRRGEAIQEQMAEGRVVNTRLTEERDRLRAENAELRKRVESIGAAAAALDSALRDAERSWPAPQPIETAPLGEDILVWIPSVHGGGNWRVQTDPFSPSALYWMHPPPPPGGGK